MSPIIAYAENKLIKNLPPFYQNQTTITKVTLDGIDVTSNNYISCARSAVYGVDFYIIPTAPLGHYEITISYYNGGTEYYTFGYDNVLDTTPPNVTKVIPAANRTDVNLNETIEITLSENIKAVNSANLIITPVVNGTITTNASIITFSHVANNFNYDTTYTVKVTGVSDQSNNIMPDYSYSFKTVKDTSALTVLNIIPPPAYVNVGVDTDIKIQFNKVIDTSSVNLVSVKTTDNIEVPVSKSINNDTLTLTFEQPLNFNSVYNLHIEGVKDTIGNSMTSPVDCNFTTQLDNTALIVMSYKPPSGNVVSLDSRIELTFNRNIDVNSIVYELKDSTGTSYLCAKSVIGKVLYLTPQNLKNGTSYNFSLISVSDLNGIGLSNPVNISFKTVSTTGNASLDNIVSQNIGFINFVKDKGLIILGAAITIGLIFIGAKWLWRKVKKWLAIA